MLDVFYLTYDNDFSKRNFDRIKGKLGDDQTLINVHGVKGIYNAHAECANWSDTDHFFVIDGDAWLADDFDLSYVPSDEIDVYPGVPQSRCIHVWRALNPVINMVYGYGGVKLLHKDLFDRDDSETIVDMSTTIAKSDRPYWAVPEVSCTTRYNTTPFDTWKGAFREVAKLKSGEMTHGAEEKLQAWLSPVTTENFYEYTVSGVKYGLAYATQYGKDKERMARLNDYEWLREQFNKSQAK